MLEKAGWWIEILYKVRLERILDNIGLMRNNIMNFKDNKAYGPLVLVKDGPPCSHREQHEVDLGVEDFCCRVCGHDVHPTVLIVEVGKIGHVYKQSQSKMTKKVKNKIIEQAKEYFIPYGIPMRKYDLEKFSVYGPPNRHLCSVIFKHRETGKVIVCENIVFDYDGEIFSKHINLY